MQLGFPQNTVFKSKIISNIFPFYGRGKKPVFFNPFSILIPFCLGKGERERKKSPIHPSIPSFPSASLLSFYIA